MEESVQDAFVLACVHFGELQDHPPSVGWHVNTAVNRLRSEVRKVRKRDKSSIPFDESINFDAGSLKDAIIDRWLDEEATSNKLAKIYAALSPLEQRVYRGNDDQSTTARSEHLK